MRKWISLQKFVDERKSELTKEMELARSEMMAKAQSEIDEKESLNNERCRGGNHDSY